MKNVNVTDEDINRINEADIEYANRGYSFQIESRILDVLQILKAKSKEENNDAILPEIIELEQGILNEEGKIINEVEAIKSIDEYIQFKYEEIDLDPSTTRRAKSLITQAHYFLNQPKTEDEIIEKLIEEYRERIENFKKTHPNVPLTKVDIEDYANAYKKELEVFSDLDETLLYEILKKIEKDLKKVIESKRKALISSTSSKITLYLLKNEFINRPPVEFTAIIEVAESIYKEDPWGQHKPSNYEQLKIHEQWWGIEIWKHELIKDYFFSKEDRSSPAKPESFKDYHTVNKVYDLETADEVYGLIDMFAKKFSELPNFQRKECEVRTYLTNWIDEVGHGRRSRAKKKAIAACPSLKTAVDGTLKNWEDNWTKFLNARSKK